jgi:adenosylcobinamide-phosphate synthase
MSANVHCVLAVLIVEACVGYPPALFNSIGHPVGWIGRIIDRFERRWNDPSRSQETRRLLGIVAMLIVLTLAAGAGHVVVTIAGRLDYGAVIIVLVATTGLAQRSLYFHVRDVLQALNSGELPAAQTAVGRIVGRDTAHLTQNEIAAAALESLGESFNDAVVAPTFWLLVGGLPGLLAYKAINTADSMIGHREERWRSFGWTAARLDDIANLLPARIAGLILTLAAPGGFRVMWRDASKHASPNAGWPEAALAGGLSVRLGGPAHYDGVLHDRAIFGDGRLPQTADLRRGLRIYVRACALLWLTMLSIALSIGVR